MTQVNEVTGHTQMLQGTKSENEDTIGPPQLLTVLIAVLILHQTQNDYQQTDEVMEVTISNMKYAANFPVTINWNKTISLFDKGATISCMSKSCFDKLQPQPKLVRRNTYRVNSANRNSLSPI